ncbi:MAG: 30S ribosome-binding factor RbfA [Pseudobdellovibrionaceae bacterium]
MNKKDAKNNDGRRVARVEKEVHSAIAEFLIRGLKTPLAGIVTVSRVRMPADFRGAKVFVSVLGSDQDRKKSIETLQARAFEVQKYIGRELKMRYCPKLTFLIDESTEKVLKIEKILLELKSKDTPSAITHDESGE